MKTSIRSHRTHTFLFTACLSALCALSGIPAWAQQAATSAVAFAEASPAARKATLNDLAAQRQTFPPDELRDVLDRSFADSDGDIRKRAVFVIAGRAGALRFSLMRAPGQQADPPDALVRERWVAERSVLQSFRGRLEKAVSDEDAEVRDGAVLALVLLDYEPGQAKAASYAVRPETLSFLADAYPKETSEKVKVQIVKTFALTTTVTPVREKLIVQALNDASSGVLQFAAMGAGHLKLASALPKLRELLAHKDRAVRLSAVQAIAAQGTAAASYEGALRQALDAEQDEIVRKTIEGAIAQVTGAAAKKGD